MVPFLVMVEMASGDMLVTITMTVITRLSDGGALCGNINRATGKFYATEHAVCVETFCNVDVSWACLFLAALNLNQYATATAQPGLAVERINQITIPIPPLAEQRRIVAKINSILPILKAL